MMSLDGERSWQPYITRSEPGLYEADNGLSIRRRHPITSDGIVTWAVFATCDSRRTVIKRFRTLAEAKAWVSA